MQGMKDRLCSQHKMQCAMKNGNATIGMATEGLMPTMPSVRSMMGCPGNCRCDQRINWKNPEKQVDEWKEKEKKACEERNEENDGDEDCEKITEDEKDDKEMNKENDADNQ